MALSKKDCLILLNEMKEHTNIENEINEINNHILKTLKSEYLPIDTVRFINDKRPLEATDFYNSLRKNYNNKRSKLYINIVKEIEDPQEVLTTLASLQLQILLYSKNVDNKSVFFSSVRADEISRVLNEYYKSYNILNAINLLRLIKSDCKVLEGAI